MADNTLVNTYLASVITSPRGGDLVSTTIDRGSEDDSTKTGKKAKAKKTYHHTFRRYRANVQTSATIGGNIDSRTTQIQYEIGSRFDRPTEALASCPEDVPRLDASFPTSSVLAEDFLGYAKKYQNFSASFRSTSLAGVVERLGKALAALTIGPNDFTSDDIRGGMPLYISSLATLDGPVNSLTSSVFIPRLVDSVLSPDVFAVMVSAVAGEGSRVVTDVLELDVTTRQAHIPHVAGGALAQPCVEALRILGANMVRSDQGPLFAYALARGLHSVLSLVGHTDEGGVMRDVFRVACFDAPYGGVHYGLEWYSGLPAISTNNKRDLAAFVDGITVATAALVAHADPGQEYNGRWFPTVLQGTGPTVKEVRPGDSQDGTPEMAAANKAQMANLGPAFARYYSAGLGEIFAAPGASDIVERHMSVCFRLISSDCRHLRYPTVAPFFWVEPTGVLPPDLTGSPAEANGVASLCYRGTEVTRDAWEGAVRVGGMDLATTSVIAGFRGARFSWFLMHWLNHPANGLGSLSVRQLDPNLVIQPGPCDDEPQVRDRVEAGLPLTSFLWRRGQSPFPAPAEFLNLGGAIGLLARHLTLDDDGLPHEEHLPTAREFIDTSVTMRVGRLVSIANGQSNTYDSGVRRARTRATRELAAARARTRLYGSVGVSEMPISTTTPTAPTAPGPSAPLNPTTPGAVTDTTGRHTGSVIRKDGPDGEPVGDPKVPVVHHDANRGPPQPPQNVRGPALAPPGGALTTPPPPPAQDDDTSAAPPTAVEAGTAQPKGQDDE